MARYNHGVVERKWRVSHKFDDAKKRVCTVLVPKESDELDLENARLLVLTDFFAALALGEKPHIICLGAKEHWPESVGGLGLVATSDLDDSATYDFGVIPRDYTSGLGQRTVAETFCPGRLLETCSLAEVFYDFGADALRVYFLYMGPPERDYVFNWHGLVSAHRFIQRVWQLGLNGFGLTTKTQLATQEVLELKSQVKARVLQRKPHIALAAIMGYLKHRSFLGRTEVLGLAEILRPFTPFLSAELTSLMATIQD